MFDPIDSTCVWFTHDGKARWATKAYQAQLVAAKDQRSTWWNQELPCKLFLQVLRTELGKVGAWTVMARLQHRSLAPSPGDPLGLRALSVVELELLLSRYEAAQPSWMCGSDTEQIVCSSVADVLVFVESALARCVVETGA